MALELIYTSAEAGIRPGTHGFCTVAASRELPAPLASTLESLSGYRHLFPPKTPNARFNPVACSHLTLPFNGKPIHIVSRIADAGLDYTDRTNKIAHHLVLQRSDLIEAGPAALFGMPNLCVEKWNSKPTIFPSAKTIPAMNIAPAICKTWDRFGGDPGWGGVLAASVLRKRPVSIVAAIGMDILPLFQEAIALLPENRRWEATFSTYYSKLPPGVEALWKGVLTGSAEEGFVRAIPRVLVLDLTRPLGDISRYCDDGATAALVEASRTGKAAAVDGEEPALNTEPGLGFSKDAASRAAGGLSFTKNPSAPPVSAIPPVLNPAPGSGELSEIERSAAKTKGSTPSRQTAETEPKKKSANLYVWALVTAVVFVCLLALGGGYLQYRRDVAAVTNRLESLRRMIAGEGEEKPGWQKIISDINDIAVPEIPKELKDRSEVEKVCGRAEKVVEKVKEFVDSCRDPNTNSLPEGMPEGIKDSEIDEVLKNLGSIQDMTSLEERKQKIEKCIEDINNKEDIIRSNLVKVKREVQEKKSSFLTEMNKNKEIEEGFLLGTLKIKSTAIVNAKKQVVQELRKFQGDARKVFGKKAGAFRVSNEDLQGVKNELELLKGTLASVADVYSFKTTLDTWQGQRKEWRGRINLLTERLQSASNVRISMISKLTEPNQRITQIFSAKDWRTFKDNCQPEWHLQVSLRSIFPDVNEKYTRFSDNAETGGGEDTPIVIYPGGDGLFFIAREDSDDRDINDVLLSKLTWSIVDQNEETVQYEKKDLSSEEKQILEERSISAGAIILEPPKKQPNANDEKKEGNSSEDSIQETADDRFWGFIQQKFAQEAVSSECSGLTMYEIRPIKDGGASLAFGIRRKKIARGQSETTQEIRLLYNRQEFSIEDTVFIDPTYFEQWLREFEKIESIDEGNYSYPINRTLRTPISLVGGEDKNNPIMIVLFNFVPAKPQTETSSEN